MPGAALLMEMGTGKTLTSIAVAGRGYLNGKVKKLLVVNLIKILRKKQVLKVLI